MKRWMKPLNRIPIMALVLSMMLCIFPMKAFAFVEGDVNGTETEAPQTSSETEEIIIVYGDEDAQKETAAAIPETEAETVVAETGTEETESTPFSVSGNAEVVDDITDDSSKEFFTITTANGNTFFLIIDRSSTSENVYLLSRVDEYDLQDFIEETEPETETSAAVVILEETEAAVQTEPETTQTEPETPETEAEETKGGTNMGMLFSLLIVVVVGAGAAYLYFGVYKPRQQEDSAGSEGMEYDSDILATERDDVEEDDDPESDGSDEDEESE